MVSSWLLKMVLGIAFVGFAVIELGSPLIAKAQADDAAHAVADAGALALVNRPTLEAMQAVCQEAATEAEVRLVSCEVVSEGRVEAKVVKTAKSFLLHKFEQTKGWYEVEASASADQPGR